MPSAGVRRRVWRFSKPATGHHRSYPSIQRKNTTQQLDQDLPIPQQRTHLTKQKGEILLS